MRADGALAVGIGLDKARIDRETLATNQPGRDAGCYDAREDIALAEALVAGA